MQGRGGRFEGMRNEGKKYIARKILEDKLAPNLYFEFDLRQKKKNNWKLFDVDKVEDVILIKINSSCLLLEM